MTSSALSDISSQKYGYDYVVAVTQASINATMLEYLSGLPDPEVEICFVAEVNPTTGLVEPKEISYPDLLARTDNVDPFTVTIPTTNPQDDPNFQKLVKAKFMMGIKVQIGIPPMDNLTAVPDMVVLGGDTARVGFNLLCSEFIVAGIQNEWNVYSWNRTAQGRNDPWIYSTYVDLRFGEVPGTAYSKLPSDVQKTIKNLGNTAFSIQQLLFDLSNAGLAEVPKISGLDNTVLKGYVDNIFVPRYIGRLRDKGEPVLGCAVVPRATPTSTLGLTGLDFSISPYVDNAGKPLITPSADQLQLTTLNYLCNASAISALPPPSRFAWNWVDELESTDTHGIISISRSRLRDWLRPLVQPQAASHCTNLTIFAKHHNGNITLLYVELHRSGIAQPVEEAPAEGKTVLRYTHATASSDSDPAGKAEIQYKYSMDVDLVDNHIVITQRSWVWNYIKAGAVPNDNVMVDSVVTDTYEIGVGSAGQLTIHDPVHSSVDTANPEGRSSFVNFWTGLRINDDMDDIINSLRSFVELQLGSVPLSTAQQFIFPGGKTFLFNKPSFSQFQDLVSHIQYAEPSGV